MLNNIALALICFEVAVTHRLDALTCEDPMDRFVGYHPRSTYTGEDERFLSATSEVYNQLLQEEVDEWISGGRVGPDPRV